MKNLYPALIILIIVFSVAAIADEQQVENYTFETGSEPSLHFSNIVGDLTITGWDRNVIEVEAVKNASGSHASSLLKALKVVARQSGDSVSVEVDYPNKRVWKNKSVSVSVNFNIKVPMGTEVTVGQNITGNLEISNLSNELEVEMITGNFIGDNLRGEVEISLVSGNITANGVNASTEIELTSGNLDLTAFSGDLEIELTSGQVNVEAIDISNLEIDSTAGDITVRIANAISRGSFEINSMSSDVDLFLAAGSSFTVQAKSGTGDLDSDFGLSIDKKTMNNRMSGVVNGGGATISIKMFSGDIAIRKN